MLVVALPGPAPPIRTNTSWSEVGFAEWSAEAFSGPTSIRVSEFTGPASTRRPASFTPDTSPTLIAVTPLSGMIVARPRPRATVSARSMLIVSSMW